MKKFAGAVMWVLQEVFDPENPDQNPTDGSTRLTTRNLTENDGGSNFKGSSLNRSSKSTENPTENPNKKLKPWMLCPPNEKEGRFLLNEIMMGGNFGQHDTRIKHGGNQLSHAWEKTKHNMRLLTHYPEEVMWEPVFRLYHWLWRKLELWKTL